MRPALYALAIVVFLGVVESDASGDAGVVGPSGSTRSDEGEGQNRETASPGAGESSDPSTVLPGVGGGDRGEGVPGAVPGAVTEIVTPVLPAAVPGAVPGAAPGAAGGAIGAGGGGGSGGDESGLRPSSDATAQPKEKPADITLQGGTSELAAERPSMDHSNPNNVKAKSTGRAASQTSNIQSQSQTHTENEGDPRGKNTAGGVNGRIESTEPQVGQIPLGDRSETNRDTLLGKKSTGKPSSIPHTSEPFSEAHKTVTNSKTDTDPRSSKEVSKSTDKTIPGTLPTGVSPPKATKNDTKKTSDEFQANDKRPNAQLGTDASDPTTTEAQVATSQEDVASSVTLAGTTTTTTTTVTPPSPESNVDTKLPLPNVNNALPLHHSVEKTDFSLGSSSLFALAALATLAVAAAAPAH